MKLKINDYSVLFDPGLDIHSGGLTPLFKGTVERYLNGQWIEEFAEIDEHAFHNVINCRCATSIHFDDSKNYFFNNNKKPIMFQNTKLERLNILSQQINSIENYISEIEGMQRPKFYNPQGYTNANTPFSEGIHFTDFLTPVEEMKVIVLKNARIKVAALKSEFAKLIK